MSRRPGLSAADTLLAVTTLSFDIAALEVFLPLAVGGRVELASREVAVDGRRLAEALTASGATVLQATPASWRLLLDSGWEGAPGLTILCGGEALTRDLARRLLGKGKAVWNLYGPTETTVWSTLARVEAGQGLVPIGRPIENTRAYVLDARLNPVPVGVTGELYLGGAGLARGYHDRPDLTAERFPADPFAPEPGARMYRTGDLARFRPGGVIECLGRSDGQVKIRGYRVELGDVESGLAAHPAVAAAAALAVDDPAGFKTLVGYLVPRGGETPSVSDLRGWLKARLPEYMVPSAFVVLDAMPMTPNGKVDRKALPDPEHGKAAASEPAVAPRDEVEERLARIWEDVLAVRPVGVNQSFFDLGGHSLLAIRLLGRIEEEFGRRLALAALFRGPTVEELAHVLRAEAPRAGPGPWTPLVAIRPEGEKPPFFCVHPAGGIVYCFQDLARQLGGDRPFYALQAAGLEGDEPPFEVFEEMAARYVEAVRGAQPEGPYHLGGWSLGGVIAFEMARQLVAEGEAVGTVALFDSWAPTALERGVAEAQKALAEEVAALGLFDDDGLAGSTEELAFVLGQFPPEIVEEFGGDALRLIAHLRELPPDDRRAYVLKAFQLDLVYHLETGPEQVERLWNVLRANLIAGSKYEPGVYPGRVVLFRAGDAKDAP
ncbi:MAG: alpha/beta fold hydrolase, partial [Planctomycetia bacterium]|nr:alpha/beta fold hydrolase [Planctomycetia bacterium]